MTRRAVMLTGLSGSGKSSAARALEDEGFFVVDNLPLALLPQMLAMAEQQQIEAGIAVVIDARNRTFFAGWEVAFEHVEQLGFAFEIIYLEASDEVLTRRYSETRRRHPLAPSGQVGVGISAEREQLAQLRDRATLIIDSSYLTPHQLRREVIGRLGSSAGPVPLTISLQSFGFRYGLPLEADLVLDVRFLPNPHFVPALQPLTGLDLEVQEFVINNPTAQDFLVKIKDLFGFLLPEYRQEGKSYLTIGIGCTGGRHRSVSIVEELNRSLSAEGCVLSCNHRDRNKR